MSMYERGYRTGLEDHPHPGLSDPCPVAAGYPGYIAWHDGYREGRKANRAINRTV